MTEDAWRKGNEELRDTQSKTKDECVSAAKRIYDAIPVDSEVRGIIKPKPMNNYTSSYLYSRIDMHIAKDVHKRSAWRVKKVIEEGSVGDAKFQ